MACVVSMARDQLRAHQPTQQGEASRSPLATTVAWTTDKDFADETTNDHG
jgi:hypothetical protein